MAMTWRRFHRLILPLLLPLLLPLQTPSTLTAYADVADGRSCSLSIKLEKGSSWEYENCIFLKSGGGFTFHWTYDRPTRTIDGCFSADWPGWLGWGVGVRMIGASALVALPADDGSNSNSDSNSSSQAMGLGNVNNTSGYLVARYYLAAKDAQEIRPNTGELNLFNNSIQVHVEQETVRVMFAAVLPEEQAAGMYIIMAKGPGGERRSGMLLAHDPSLTAHTYIRLIGGGPAQWLQGLHGAVNTAAWGILLPIGALVARHMRDIDTSELWYTLHRGIQAVGYCLGSFGFFLGLLMWGQSHEGRTRRRGWGGGDEGDFDTSTHRNLGITIFALASFQFTAALMHPHRDAILRPWWQAMHHWTGRLLLVLAVFNIWEGMGLLHPAVPAWPYVYGIPLGLLVVAASLLEAFLLWRWLTEEYPQTPFQQFAQSLLPRGLRHKPTHVQDSEEALGLIDEQELESMAHRIKRDLQAKEY